MWRDAGGVNSMKSEPHEYRGARPRYDAVLMSVTERCHVGCRHCGFIGTKREREPTLAHLTDWAHQICSYGIERLIITGGEPFERYEALCVVTDVAHRAETNVGIFTSSYWGKSVEAAIAALTPLKNVVQLFLSADPYHQERVNIQSVHNVIEAAIHLNIPYISVCITYGNKDELSSTKAAFSRWGNVIQFHEDRVIPTQFLSKKTMARQAAGIAARASNFERTCYLRTPIVNPNGDVIACHSGKAAAHKDMRGSPYFLGNLNESSFADIASSASRRWDYQFLRTQGPKGVASLAESDPTILTQAGRETFSNPCDMCFSILRTEAGRAALRGRVRDTDIRESINIRLALGLGEDPISD